MKGAEYQGHWPDCGCSWCVIRRGDLERQAARKEQERAPKFVEAIRFKEDRTVHAALAPGTCYLTACRCLLECWAVRRAEVMSVDCPECLRVLEERRSAAAGG